MTDASLTRQTAAAAKLKQFEPTRDAERITASLQAGLSLLVDRFYWRIHFDVETLVGADSLVMPVSEVKAAKRTKEAIEVFQIVESAWAFREFGYAVTPGDWYLPWLGEFRLGERLSAPEVIERLEGYQRQTPSHRRLAFMDHLLEVLPESGKSPLILPRLLPPAVHLATALAFEDPQRARTLRAEQIALLPAIDECNRCQGRVLENGDVCDHCGNPLWNYRWLTET
jgi:hypothetical protein